VTLDELLAAVAADLRAIGHGGDLAGIDAATDDVARARVLYDAAAAVRFTGRLHFVRSAAAFASHALRCRGEGDLASSDWWRGCAVAELDRYREPGLELHPYVVSGGPL
jgi:hypothetical protein